MTLVDEHSLPKTACRSDVNLLREEIAEVAARF